MAIQQYQRKPAISPSFAAIGPAKGRIAVFFILLGCFCVCASAATSAERQLDQRLQQRISLTWEGQQLGHALRRLEELQEVVVWLDRRVDPSTKIDLAIRDTSLGEAIYALAEEADLGVATLGGVVYIGPIRAARKLPILAKRARQSIGVAPREVQQKWLQVAAADWPRLSEPRVLLTKMMADARLKLIDEQQIAHDLWAAKRLPPLALVDRVVLVLIGFDLTCQVTRNGDCRVVAIRWRADEKLAGKTIPGKRLGRSSRKAKNRTEKTKQVFRLRLKEQPVNLVLEQLAGQLELTLDWDESVTPEMRKKRVSCELKEVSLDELLDAVLGPIGLRAIRSPNRLEIEPAS